jgi:hypothetical protein
MPVGPFVPLLQPLQPRMQDTHILSHVYPLPPPPPLLLSLVHMHALLICGHDKTSASSKGVRTLSSWQCWRTGREGATLSLQIVVLSGGKVVERGTHDQLLEQQGGMYQRLVRRQMHWKDEKGEATDNIDKLLEVDEAEVGVPPAVSVARA